MSKSEAKFEDAQNRKTHAGDMAEYVVTWWRPSGSQKDMTLRKRGGLGCSE